MVKARDRRQKNGKKMKQGIMGDASLFHDSKMDVCQLNMKCFGKSAFCILRRNEILFIQDWNRVENN